MSDDRDQSRQPQDYRFPSPALQRLRGDSQLFWSLPSVRYAWLDALVEAWEHQSSQLEVCVARIDHAVTDALALLGLPRGEVLGVEVESALRFAVGRKTPACRIVLNGPQLRQMLRVHGNTDDLVRTWTHESLHARQPYDAAAPEETRLYQGYEEGLVECLARMVVRDKAGLRPLERSYAYYVAAYETLAVAAQLPLEAISEHLWLYPTGRVHIGFVDVIDSERIARGSPLLSMEQRARLRTAADRMFSTLRRDAEPARDAMLATWQLALKP